MTDRSDNDVLWRVRMFSFSAYALIMPIYLFRAEWKSLLGLTCSAAVVMINFLWLEDLLVRVLQPTPRSKTWRLTVSALGRFALFGVALAFAIVVARIDALSVLLGFSILVIGILTEAVYSTVLSFKS